MEDETSEEAVRRCLIDRHRVSRIRNPRRRGRGWGLVTRDFHKLSGKSMQLRTTVNEMTGLKPCNAPQATKSPKEGCKHAGGAKSTAREGE